MSRGGWLRKLKQERYVAETDGGLTIRQSLKQLLWFGLPTAVSFTATTLSNTMAFTFVGAYDDEAVQAGHGLGYSIGNMLILTVGLGLVNGMDTLCPLSIGAGHPQGCWAHLFQALAIVVLTIPVLSPLLIFSEPLLVALKQDADVSHIAAKYLIVGLPGLFLMSSFEAGRKFLVYHHCTTAHTLFAILCIPLQSLFLYIFVKALDMGAPGAGVARSLTWLIMALTIYTYIYWYRDAFYWDVYMRGGSHKESQPEAEDNCTAVVLPTAATAETVVEVSCTLSKNNNSPETPPHGAAHNDDDQQRSNAAAEDQNNSKKKDGELSPLASQVTQPEVAGGPVSLVQSHTRWWYGIPHFLKVAVPSAFLCVFEWVAFEIQIFLAAYLGSVELSAIASSSSLGALLFIVSLSIAVTLNSDIGRAMGARRPKDGETLAKAGCLASLCVSVSLALGVLAFRPWIATAYSQTEDIRNALYDNLLLLVFVVVVDSLHAILGGEIKAINLQWYGCIFDAVNLLGTMQVVGVLLAYRTHLKGRGFLTGCIAGLSFNIIGYLTMLFCCVNWDRRSEVLTGARKGALTTTTEEPDDSHPEGVRPISPDTSSLPRPPASPKS